MAAIGIYSILISVSAVPWTDDITFVILFLFSLALSYILVRRFVRMYAAVQSGALRLGRQSEELRSLNLQLEKKVQVRTRQLELANKKLEEEKNHLEITAITDDLTHLYNRRYIRDRIQNAIGQAKRYDQKLSVIMLDLDHFKEANDSYGHRIGDEVLRGTAQVFRETLREADLAGRYGGEEFLIILPQTDSIEAFAVAERIRSRFEQLKWSVEGLNVTVSGGIAELDSQENEQPDELIDRADKRLYLAKEAGRNRIIGD
jgi:diguanylate cyclase (GGDEF)-like protein